jgi:hypothetical protein
MKETTETLIDDTGDVYLEINLEGTMYMLLSRHQITCKIRDMKITDSLKIRHS